MGEAFTAGIRPGGLTEENQVRILVCHILGNAEGGLSFDQLTEIVLSDEMANYFEFAEALGALTEISCVEVEKNREGENVYLLTDKGREAVSVLARELPASIRERSAELTRQAQRRRRLAKENLAAIDRAEEGYIVHMRVTDIGTDLMELRLFMPTFEQAQKVKARFLEDPATAYASVLAALAEI